MSAFTRSRGRSLVATATTALVFATIVPSTPAFADEGEPPAPITSITGIVTDPAGLPAPDTCLTAELLDGTAWATFDLGAEFRTDADGVYALTDLPDGTYTISAEACTAVSDTLRTWAPSLPAQPAVIDGNAADAVVVTGGIAASAVDIDLLPAAVTNTQAPVVTGDAIVGAELIADPGTWSVTGLAFAFQWLRNGTPIDGATGQTYTPTPADVTATLAVDITATRDGWTGTTARSPETPAVPALLLTAGTPSITGDAVVGATLTASAGTWSPETVEPTFAWQRDGVDIADATASTYVLTGDDLGATIAVRATYALDGYLTESRDSAPTAPVVAGTLTTSAPTVTGTAKVGSTLTVTPAWSPANVAYSYVWQRNGAAIPGATNPSYVPVAADLGAKLTVAVTGDLAGYTSVTRTSAATTAVAIGTFSSPAATVTGTVAVGRTVTAVPGTWKPGATFTYQWKRNGAAISGATKSTYAITATDLKTALTVTITGTASGYTTATRTSAPITVATGTLTAPTPTISGTRAVGKTLTAVTGTWTSGTTLTYQWKRNGVAVTGATTSTFALTSWDLGKTITVTVAGKKTAYASASKTSAATAAIAAGTLTAPTPTISGTRTVGKTLTAVTGTWTSGTTLTYQWKRNGVAVTGATKSTFALTSWDLGKTITVTVAGKKTGYTSVGRTSSSTAEIAAGTISASPKLSGTQRAGYRVSVLLGTIAPSDTTVKYQWYRNGTAISGKTGSSYVLGNVDGGKVVSVKITFSRTGYTTRTVTLATAKVAYRPASVTGDGWFRVGIDIAPGTYFTSSTSTTYCQWWRTSSADGSAASVLGYDAGGSGRRMITILSTDRYVVFSGCGSWVRYDGTGTQSTTMPGDGIAAVGVTLRPGRYVSYGNYNCYAGDWARPTGDIDDLLAGGFYDGDLYWIVESGTYFETYGCNTFTWYSY